MCGIVGWVRAPGREDPGSTLSEITDLLRHRGPDEGGHWQHTTTDGYRIAFGHRRLSIIDLAAGQQPMSSHDGRFVICYNGEVYNYVELREELRARGATFQTNSDTEVVIEAFRVWGTDCFARFRGMFGLALYDGRTGSVFLARDHFGKKPLFYHSDGASVVFSSEIAPILAAGVPKRLSKGAVAQYLYQRYVCGPGTFFEGISKLMPGHFAEIKKGRVRTERFYTPPFATEKVTIKDPVEAEAMFVASFDEAVRLRMRSDVKVGTFLSGGLDSSAVLSSMAACTHLPVSSYSVGFDEQEYSELRYAKIVAERYGADHHELVITPDDFARSWATAVTFRGAPLSEAADIPILLLSQAASASIKVVLTGEGSDELLAGYPKYKAERWISSYHALVPEFLHNHAVNPLIQRLPSAMRRVKVAANALVERDQASRMQAWFSNFTRQEQAELLGHHASFSSCTMGDDVSGLTPARRVQYQDQLYWLPDNLLERADRMMMAHSIEGRMPFMDTELASLVARFDEPLLTGHPKGKAVLRSAMKKRLPSEILERRKVGFRVPVGLWFKGMLKDRIYDLIQSEGSVTKRLYDDKTRDGLVASHMSGQRDNERALWAMANLEVFVREHGLSV